MRAHFPQYEYDDMVAAQHELLEKGLGVNHLRLILGTSMGCMHSWVGRTYPDFMDALMALAASRCRLRTERLWRKMVIDGIRDDPDWKKRRLYRPAACGLETAAECSTSPEAHHFSCRRLCPPARRPTKRMRLRETLRCSP